MGEVVYLQLLFTIHCNNMQGKGLTICKEMFLDPIGFRLQNAKRKKGTLFAVSVYKTRSTQKGNFFAVFSYKALNLKKVGICQEKGTFFRL